MLKTHLKLITITIIILIFIITCWIKYQQYQITQTIKKQAEISQQFNQNFKADLEKQPFRQHLPFKADDYQIFYDSLNQQIVILITNPSLSLEEAKNNFYTSIYSYLNNIGVDFNQQKIIWLQ